MALFSLKRIAGEAENRQTYLRGVACYNAGKVGRVVRDRDDFYEEYLSADVENNTRDGVFHVEVGFGRQGDADFYDCGCEAYRQGTGACQHIVAVMVHKYYADMLTGLSAPPSAREKERLATRTDETARRMMNRYLSRQAVDLVAHSAAGQEPVLLSPVLRLGQRQAELSFTLGRRRPYVLKDIGKFCEDVKKRETVEYGKQLRFLHHPDSFDPACRGLLAFLLDTYEDIAHPQRGTIGSLHPRIGRELLLSPAALDRFFAVCEGKEIALRSDSPQEKELRPLFLKSGDPALTLDVQRSDVKEGFQLSGELFSALCGTGCLYVAKDGVLYRCTQEYAEQMRDFLPALQAAGHTLFIADGDMPDFCGSVLPAVGRFMELTGQAERLEPYLPEDPDIEITLDSPEPGLVTARVLCCYGGEKVPLLDTDDAHRTEGGPRRNRLEELRSRLVIQQYFPNYIPSTGLMVSRVDDDGFYRLLTEGLAELQGVGTVALSDAFRTMDLAPPPRLSVGVGLSGGLLDFEFETEGLDAGELTRVVESYRRRQPYHRLKNGRFLPLEGALAEFARLADGLELGAGELAAGHARLPTYRALYLDRVLRDSATADFRRDVRFRELTGALRNAADADYRLPASLEEVLRPYQKTGYRWLKTMERYGFGGILADDMGLGKTLELISLLLDAKEAGQPGPSLVVCPASLIFNWENEIRRFAPALTVLPILGNAEQREQAIAGIGRYDVAVTSYDLLKRDIALYGETEFRYLVLDEAQYIKNHATQNAKAVKALRSRQRFALTGTPIENRLSELWSIFDFLMPGFLYSYNRFRDSFELPIVKNADAEALDRLHRMTAPFILRRLKRDVLHDLPEKTETIRTSVMGEEQRALYLGNVLKARERLADLTSGNAESGRMVLLALLTRLRQLCCDPALCYEDYTGGSAKLESCLELLREAADGGHKVLLFSQFTSMLAILEERLRGEGITFYTLQGSTSKEKRAALVEAFNRDATQVFLISLKAGGTGLNLTGADVVIHYDPWWNLSAQEQATDRAHRIGQKNSVQVYKLIAKDTIEEKILRLQESKKELADAVIRQGGSLFSLSPEQLAELLA